MLSSEEVEIASDTVHGIAAMSAFTGLAERKLYHLATNDMLPGAFKIGRSWALLKSVYVAELHARATRSVRQPVKEAA